MYDRSVLLLTLQVGLILCWLPVVQIPAAQTFLFHGIGEGFIKAAVIIDIDFLMREFMEQGTDQIRIIMLQHGV